MKQNNVCPKCGKTNRKCHPNFPCDISIRGISQEEIKNTLRNIQKQNNNGLIKITEMKNYCDKLIAHSI